MSEELKVLLAKDAIRDQIYTYCQSLDRIDNDLGYSVFAEDSHVNYGPTFPSGTGREFIDMMLDIHRTIICTHHMMTNLLIKVDGDKAMSQTYMYACCKYPNGEHTYSVEARCRDIDNWECRDGKWLIVNRVVTGDNTRILSRYKDLEDYNGTRNDRNDPSYILFPELKK